MEYLYDSRYKDGIAARVSAADSPRDFHAPVILKLPHGTNLSVSALLLRPERGPA